MKMIQLIGMAVAMVGSLLTYSASNSDAATQVIRSVNGVVNMPPNGTITMNSGTHTGLQLVFANDNHCRAVPVAFSGHATAGRLTRVGGVFRVRAGLCRGRKVKGFAVVYLAPRGFKGTARVNYTLKAANRKNYFRFTRLMNIR